MKKALIILPCVFALVVTTACGRDGRVRQVHIDAAIALCEANGGIGSIKDADMTSEYESCGHKCSRPTGKTLYRADLTCNNGAKFDMQVSK